jgi:GrpB-like predicted nucleotidyltransferase (UPF0157 family)
MAYVSEHTPRQVCDRFQLVIDEQLRRHPEIKNHLNVIKMYIHDESSQQQEAVRRRQSKRIPEIAEVNRI